MSKKNVPEVRFKEFSESWDEKKLNEIVDIVGGGTPSTQIPEYWDGDIDWYSPTEIGEKVYADGSVKKITKLGFEKSGARMLPTDKTVLFTSRAGIGDTAILKRTGCTNQGFQSLVLKNGSDAYFIYSTSNQIKKYALKYASGSTFLEISGKQLGNMELKIPLELEQKKLGVSFQNIDRLITLYSEKYEKLLNIKKAMLEKMFPKDCADVPEIRFKGFTGKWSTVRLGDQSIIKGRLGWKSLKQKEYLDEGPAMIAGKHISDGVINWNSVDHIPQWRYEESPEIMLKEGDVIFSKDGSLGNPAVVKNLNCLATINSTMMLVRLKKEFSPQYFYQVLKSSTFDRLIKMKVSGSSIPHLFQADMKEFIFQAPSYEEQKQIGTYLRELDDLINVQNAKIEKLKNIKKAMLEKMFV